MRKPNLIHDLKIHPEPFRAVQANKKTAELRKMDRDYQVGDLLRLKEFDPDSSEYTGQFVLAEITHITKLNDWIDNLMAPYGMLSMRRLL